MASLFEAIECLVQFPIFHFAVFVDMTDVYVMVEDGLKVGCYNILLSDFPIFVQGDNQKHFEYFWSHHLGEGLVGVIGFSSLLGEAPPYLSGFVFFNTPVWFSLDDIDPLCLDDLSSFKNIRFFDFRKYPVFDQLVPFLFSSFGPFGGL